MRTPYKLRSAARLYCYRNVGRGGARIALLNLLLKYGYCSLLGSEGLDIAETSNYCMPPRVVDSFNYALN